MMTSFSLRGAIVRDKWVIFFYIDKYVILLRRTVMQAFALLWSFAESRFDNQVYLTSYLPRETKEIQLA